MLLVVFMNICGLIFMTWIVGEIAVIIFHISQDVYQMEIDIVNAAMRDANLPTELQSEIRDYFMKVLGPMGEQEELTAFFGQISAPLRIAVQREMFTTILSHNNKTIQVTRSRGMINSNKASSIENLKGLSSSELIAGRMERFLPSIVERLDTSLQLPYSDVIEQSTNEDQEEIESHDDSNYDVYYA